MDRLVIHITGPSGAGKTTLGNEIKNHFGSKIKVRDLDDLRRKFINSEYGNSFSWRVFDSKKYQKYLDDYISSDTKPLVLTGLNQIFWHNKKLYYNVHSKHNYYIHIDDMTVVRQKCLRFLTEYLPYFLKSSNFDSRDITDHNRKFVKVIKEDIEIECGTETTTKLIHMWEKNYKKQGYIFMSREEIYETAIRILGKALDKKGGQDLDNIDELFIKTIENLNKFGYAIDYLLSKENKITCINNIHLVLKTYISLLEKRESAKNEDIDFLEKKLGITENFTHNDVEEIISNVLKN